MVDVVSGIDINVGKGEFVVFFGFNGVGKMIILKFFFGVINLISGMVRVLGYVFWKCENVYCC